MMKLAACIVMILLALPIVSLAVDEEGRSYLVDPLLQQAFEMYEDYEGRDREKAISLFEEYLAKDPNSIFAPEIYFIMSSMFGGNVNVNHGETIDFKRMREYLLKAHEGYKGKYCIKAAVAYGRLNFMPGTLETRLEYYDWLLNLQRNGTPEDLYDVRSIAGCIKGFSPRRSDGEMKHNWEHLREAILPHTIEGTEKRIYQDSFQEGRNTYMDLAIIAKRYPDTPLGKNAQHALDEADEDLGVYQEPMEITNSEMKKPDIMHILPVCAAEKDNSESIIENEIVEEKSDNTVVLAKASIQQKNNDINKLVLPGLSILGLIIVLGLLIVRKSLIHKKIQ